MISRLVVALIIALLLIGCAARPVRVVANGGGLSAQVLREAALANEVAWSFSGRVAVRNQGQGGSGAIAWQQRGEDFEITLSAPISRQGWRLVKDGQRARLEGLEGGVREGPDAEMLLREATGWTLPVSAMVDWLRGGRHRLDAQLQFGPDGLPVRMTEQGWDIEYREWQSGAAERPRRIFAAQGEASVRLVIERWSVP